MTATTRDRFATVVRDEPVDLAVACLLIASEADPELSVQPWLDVLDELAAGLTPLLGPGDTADDVAAALQAHLGDEQGFAGRASEYADLRGSLLHEVLRRRTGLPILLSVVWLEVARRAGVAAYGIGTPGHFLVGIGDPAGEHVVVDPFNGGMVLDADDVAALVEDAAGVPFTPDQLAPSPPADILLRILTNIRVHAAGQPLAVEAARTQLWAVELSLLLPRHPLELRREHGEALLRLGDFVRAAQELEAYAAVAAGTDQTAADEALLLARRCRARLN